MPNTTGDVDRRLNEIEERLARLESHLGLEQAATEEPAPPAPPPLPQPVLPPEPLTPAPPPISVLPYVAPPPAVAQPPRLPQGALEQTIGLKWAGWIGAIVLVVGAAFGVRYAYDIGLLNFPRYVWLGLIFAAGLALIAAGEWVYRRVNELSAAGLYGAGVATLFLASYVGHAYYRLYAPDTAFALMAVSTLVGAAVAVRGKLVSIAALSILGGSIAPAILHAAEVREAAFLSYLLALQLVALFLAWWGREPKWWTLRGLSLASISLWTLAALGDPRFHPKGAPLYFCLLYAVLYQLELILSARRAAAQRNAAPMFSVLVTALLTTAVLSIFHDASHAARGAWVLGIAAACAACGFALTRSETFRPLAIGFRIQSAALLVVAVPVALAGPWISIGWGGLALAFAALGAAMDLRVSRHAAAFTWVLSLAALVHFTTTDTTSDAARRAVLTLAGTPLPLYLLLACILTWIGHAIAYLTQCVLRRDGIDARLPEDLVAGARLLSIAAGVVWAIAAINALPPLGATAALVLYAWLLAVADLPAPRLAFAAQSMAVLAIAAAKWVVVDTLADRLSPDWTATKYLPVFNPLMGTGLLIAASLVALYWLRRRSIWATFHVTARPPGQPAAPTAFLTVIAAVCVLLLVGLSAEVDRVVERAVAIGQAFAWPPAQLKNMSWTMLWTFCVAGFAAMVAVFEPDRPHRRAWLSFLTALAVCLVAKFVFLDTFYFHLIGGSRGLVTRAPAIITNFQSLTAAVVVAGLIVIRYLTRADLDPATPSRLPTNILALAALVVLWAGSFEIDRAVATFGPGPWPAWQLRQLGWTIWWAAGLAAYLAISRQFEPFKSLPALRRSHLIRPVSILIGALAIKYLTLDTLFPRLLGRPVPATVMINFQAMTAAVVLAGLIVVWYFTTRARRQQSDTLPGAIFPVDRLLSRVASLSVLVLLWAGTLEIDRAFATLAPGTFQDPALARQVGFSIFWAVFAIASIAGGFQVRAAPMRYFGLGLFALTLLKVVLVDMSHAATGYRVLSFMGLGLLLLGTSVLYGKLSPRLLREPSEPSISPNTRSSAFM